MVAEIGSLNKYFAQGIQHHLDKYNSLTIQPFIQLLLCFRLQPSETSIGVGGVYHINSEAHYLISPNMHLNSFLIFSNKEFYCESYFHVYFVNY